MNKIKGYVWKSDVIKMVGVTAGELRIYNENELVSPSAKTIHERKDNPGYWLYNEDAAGTVCTVKLLRMADDAAKRLNLPLHIGPLYCSDTLYDDDIDYDPVMKKMHVLAAEMESAGLYLEGMRSGKNALCLCTIVENAYTGEEASPKDRENTLDGMIRIALQIALDYEEQFPLS